MVDMMPVNNENILTIGYDDKNNSLHVKYDDNSLYKYCNIELEMFTNLLFSSSKSSFLKDNILEKFRCIKID